MQEKLKELLTEQSVPKQNLKTLLEESYETLGDGIQRFIPKIKANIDSWKSSACKEILSEKPSKKSLAHLEKCLKEEKKEGYKEIIQFIHKITSGKYKSDEPIFEQQIKKFFKKLHQAIS